MAFTDAATALLFRIKGDSSDAVKAFETTRAAVKTTTKDFDEFNASFKKLESHANDADHAFKQWAHTQGLNAEEAFKVKTAMDAETAAIAATEAAIIGATTAIVAGFAVVAGAALVAGKQLFDLAKQASDYGSQIHDAAQQTGLGTDAIQALRFAAEQSGSSFEAINGAVAKFSVLMGEAKDGNEEALATLKQYHIEVGDTDEALAKAVKTIASMTDHDQKAAAAKALFRDRAAAILPVIESFDGDLQGLIEKLREMGVIMGGDAVRTADEFGDQMDLLDRQLTAVWRTIGADLMPVFLKWSKELSGWLAKNQDEIKGWGDALAKFVDHVLLQVSRLGPGLRVLAAVARGDYIGASIETGLQVQKENAPREIRPEDTALLRYRKQPGVDTTDPDAQKKADDEAKAAAEKRRQEREREVQEAIASAEKSNRAFLAAERERYAGEQEALEKSFLEHEITAQEYRDKSVENIKKYAATVRNLIENAFVIDSSQAKNQADAAAAEAERTTRIAALKREVDKEAADAIKNIEGLRKKDDADKEKAAKDEEKRVDDLIDKWKEEGKAYADKVEEEAKQIRYLQDLLDEVGGFAQGPQPGDKIGGATESTGGPFDAWLKSWEAFADSIYKQAPEITDTLGDMAGILQDAFNGFADAIGNVVQQFVLYGTTGPAVMRRILASALATIAAEAAVRAIYATAYGFLMLATGDFYAAGQAFAAAAVFATIALATGLAGRAVAGDSLKNKKGAANAVASNKSPKSSDTSGQGDQYSSHGSSPSILEEGRTAPGKAQIPVHVTVRVDDDSRWLGKMLTFDVETNGQSRRYIG